jgi:Protein of unknown function (DUF3892)
MSRADHTPGWEFFMEKWADFLTTKVKYNRDHTQIVEVEVRGDLGDSISSETRRILRQDVVSAIGRGTTFVTSYLRDGKWQKGEDVDVVTIHGERFIRTDSNSIRADNLGALPEYQ